MDNSFLLLILAGIVFVYGLFSHLLEKKSISGPMIVITFSLVFGPLGLNVLVFDMNFSIVHTIAEVALVLVLFTSASTVKLNELRKAWKIPTRLLSVGLLLAVLFGFGVAYYLFPHIDIYHLLLISLILTPTDAALGKAVVQNEEVPERLRESINVESGLNDGIIFPMILAVMALLQHSSSHTDAGWSLVIIKQIVFGFAGGALVGFVGGKLSEMAAKHHWMEDSYQRLASFALAIISYYVAEMIGGNGFIAAFVAGMFIAMTDRSLKDKLQEFGDAEGELLLATVFLFVGFVGIPMSYSYWGWNTLLYALLSLTVIRIIPVAISLLGLHLSWKEILFLGWFGPRGIASTLYAIIVFSEINNAAMKESIAIVLLTVFISIFLHGISALPFIRFLNKKPKER